MITAIVRYTLPPEIGTTECRAHFLKIAPGFRTIPGLIRKQFIWSDGGIAGGVYQWDSRASAEAFYQGPWLEGIIARYGNAPLIDYFETFAVTDNLSVDVIVP
jgi:hypothetical protein